MNNVVNNGYSDIYSDVGNDIVNTKCTFPLYEGYTSVSGRPSIYLPYERDVSLAYKKREDYIVSIATPSFTNEFDMRKSENLNLYEKMTKAVYAYFNGNDFKYGGLNIFYEAPFSCDSIDVYYYGHLLIKALNAAYNEDDLSVPQVSDCLLYCAEKVFGASYDRALAVAITRHDACQISYNEKEIQYEKLEFPFDFSSYLISFPESEFINANKTNLEANLKKINDTIFEGRRYSEINPQDFHMKLSVPLYGVDEINKLKAHILFDDGDYYKAIKSGIDNKDENAFTNALRGKTRRDIDLFYFDAPGKEKIFITYLLSNYPNLCVYCPFPFSTSAVLLLRKGSNIEEIDLRAFPDAKITELY